MTTFISLFPIFFNELSDRGGHTEGRGRVEGGGEIPEERPASEVHDIFDGALGWVIDYIYTGLV